MSDYGLGRGLTRFSSRSYAQVERMRDPLPSFLRFVCNRIRTSFIYCVYGKIKEEL